MYFIILDHETMIISLNNKNEGVIQENGQKNCRFKYVFERAQLRIV